MTRLRRRAGCRARVSSDSDAVVVPVLSVARARNGRRTGGGAICRSGQHAACRSDLPPRQDDCFRFFIDGNGRQHFNFTQQLWLNSRVDMAVTSIMTLALETLAVNLLTQVTRQRDQALAVGITSRRVLQLAPRFCGECLLTAHQDGWVIPRTTVRAWLAAHSRYRRRA